MGSEMCIRDRNKSFSKYSQYSSDSIYSHILIKSGGPSTCGDGKGAIGGHHGAAKQDEGG